MKRRGARAAGKPRKDSNGEVFKTAAGGPTKVPADRGSKPEPAPISDRTGGSGTAARCGSPPAARPAAPPPVRRGGRWYGTCWPAPTCTEPPGITNSCRRGSLALAARDHVSSACMRWVLSSGWPGTLSSPPRPTRSCWAWASSAGSRRHRPTRRKRSAGRTHCSVRPRR